MDRLNSGAAVLSDQHIPWPDPARDTPGPVGVPLHPAHGHAFSGVAHVIHGALVLWGTRDWRPRSRTAAQPYPEGAPA